ncbi:MAG: hypothetical protein ACOZB0_02070 [Pseudomonadota bacterium]
MALHPSVNAAAIVETYSAPMGEQDIGALMDSLNESMAKVWDGDMKRCEAMLLGQAHALQSIFMNLARRAVQQDYMKNYEIFLRLGLKAQSQCRATLETLAAIKNPPVAIVRQANIAHGPQQVNNGTMPNSTPAPVQARVGENQNPQTQLLETQHGEWLDTGASSKTGRTDQDLATVGAINRPQNGGG